MSTLSLSTRLFREKGFIRKKCKKCGSYFWTLDPDRVLCGDQPCVDYTFLGNPPTPKKHLSLSQVREMFLSFMERHGHTRIKRYPIVARWRDDVFLVGASIYDFQPWVTEGIIPPPANPLTISQPCIRLTDVDNVGRSGRHLTEFEMMAHHAFNYPDISIYWIDKTVELAYRFFTEELKVDPELITFKEDWWSGGGNAGEDFEVLIEGLEVATLVFMHYKVIDERLYEMKNKIVDTGYGLERITWLTSGTPTVYDAIFPDFIRRIAREVGLGNIDEKILVNVARIAGKFDVKRIGIHKFREEVARKVGLSLSELVEMLLPLENIYVLADHSRALAFMLNDGVVPSNVGAGYLARLLIRRCLRSLINLELTIPLSEVISFQISLLSRDFPEIKENEEVILDMIDEEEYRFKKTLKKGRELIKRRASRLKSKGLKELPTEELIELYDSHGLDPILVKEECDKLGINVKIPEDFYTLLAERHQKAMPKVKRAKLVIPLEEIEGLPETIPLYYKNPYDREFQAKVLRVIKDKYIILDKTLFYPEGGGQPSDNGYLLSPNGEKVKIVDVQKIGKVIVHIAENTSNIKSGDLVRGLIDFKRRHALMRSHTATHILLGAARRVLGPHVWQAGASKGIERSHLDITHYKPVTIDELRKIELLANSVVLENRPVSTYIMKRNEAEAKYGFILYQGGVVPGREIRVVEIKNWDVEACGGTHCSSTGEVGLIKIIRAERIQDGVVRLEFSVGEYALKHIHKEEDILRNVSHSLGAPIDKLPDAVNKLKYRVKSLRKELELLRSKYLSALSLEIERRAETLPEGLILIAETFEGSREEAIKVAEAICNRNPNSIVIFAGSEGDSSAYLISKIGEKAREKGISALEIVSASSRLLKGGGGGTPIFAQGGGSAIERIEDAIKYAREMVIKKLSTLKK